MRHRRIQEVTLWVSRVSRGRPNCQHSIQKRTLFQDALIAVRPRGRAPSRRHPRSIRDVATSRPCGRTSGTARIGAACRSMCRSPIGLPWLASMPTPARSLQRLHRECSRAELKPLDTAAMRDAGSERVRGLGDQLRRDAELRRLTGRAHPASLPTRRAPF